MRKAKIEIQVPLSPNRTVALLRERRVDVLHQISTLEEQRGRLSDLRTELLDIDYALEFFLKTGPEKDAV